MCKAPSVWILIWFLIFVLEFVRDYLVWYWFHFVICNSLCSFVLCCHCAIQHVRHQLKEGDDKYLWHLLYIPSVFYYETQDNLYNTRGSFIQVWSFELHPNNLASCTSRWCIQTILYIWYGIQSLSQFQTQTCSGWKREYKWEKSDFYLFL